MAQLQKREKVLAGVAGGILVIFLFNQFVCSDKKAAPPVARKKAVQQVAAKLKKVASPKNAANRPSEHVTPKNVEFASWGRSPFAEAHRLVKFDSTQVDSNAFVLRGIILRGNQAHALIGDEILKEGQRSGDLEILDIAKDRVVCKKGNKVVTLVLDDDNK